MPYTTTTDRTTGYTVTAADWNILEDNSTFLFGDPGWTAVTVFTNSWTAGGGNGPAFILIGRVVYLRGFLGAGTANTAAFTLPAGYRPSVAMNWPTTNGTASLNVVSITNLGVVTPLLSAATYLTPISFPVV